MTNAIERKAVSFKMSGDPDEEGVFEGYASVFDVVDQGLDTVKPGAFADSIASGRRVKMLWQHDQSQPIGVWDEIREDSAGLFVRGRLARGVRKAQEALELLRMGALDGMSIGYRVKEATDHLRVRELRKVDLFEVSLVTFPMLPVATVTSVKAIQTIRDFERALRDVGFSQKEAKAIAADGFAGLAAHRDDVAADEPEPEDYTDLLSGIRLLQETLNA